MITEALKDNLSKAFDKGWDEEVKPELQRRYSDTKKKIWNVNEPTLNFTHSALLLNTSLRAFKKFLMEYCYISKCGYPSDSCLDQKYFVITMRDYPNQPDVALVRLTKIGFITLGAAFVEYRRSH